MKKFSPKINFKFTNKINEIDPSSEIILMADLGISKFSKFIEVNNQISFFNKKAYGLILFKQNKVEVIFN